MGHSKKTPTTTVAGLTDRLKTFAEAVAESNAESESSAEPTPSTAWARMSLEQRRAFLARQAEEIQARGGRIAAALLERLKKAAADPRADPAQLERAVNAVGRLARAALTP